MRRKTVILAIILLCIATDVTLANLPGPVPISEAVINIEQSASFRSIISTNNATYLYQGYSNDPGYSAQCARSIFGQTIHVFSPFHQYVTTSLIFQVEQNASLVRNGTAITFFLLFVRVNPSTGHIYGIQRGMFCG
ncbi:MAG: hypothetical protein JRN15_08830 [Nitrososphaerota archaeon]|nr:hypothetical protein [Nitrososphaerota archaeon]